MSDSKTSDVILQVEGLTKCYGRGSNRVEADQDVSLTVRRVRAALLVSALLAAPGAQFRSAARAYANAFQDQRALAARQEEVSRPETPPGGRPIPPTVRGGRVDPFSPPKAVLRDAAGTLYQVRFGFRAAPPPSGASSAPFYPAGAPGD